MKERGTAQPAANKDLSQGKKEFEMTSTTGPLSEERKYTYGDILSYGTEIATAEFENPRSFVNCLGVLGGFRAFHLVSEDGCFIGAELDGNFDAALSKYIGYRKDHGKDASIPNDKSRMRWWKGVFERLQQRDRDNESLSPKNTLWETVDFYVRLAKEKNPQLSLSALCLEAGLSLNYLAQVVHAEIRSFKPSSKSSIEKLEKSLEIPAGLLTRFCSEESSSEGVNDAIEYRSRLHTIQRQRLDRGQNFTYRPWEFGEILNDDWTQLLLHKTKSLVPGLDLKRNLPWRLKPISECKSREELSQMASLSPDGTNYAPAAGDVLQRLCQFFGGLRELSDSDGQRLFNPDGFRLPYLIDSALLGIVATHLEKRLSGFTTTLVKIYRVAESLLRAKEGFIWQRPDYVSALLSKEQLQKLVTPEQLQRILRHELDDGRVVERPEPELFANLNDKEKAQKWHAWCDDQLQLLKERLRELKKEGKILAKTRNPEDPIKTYLDWEEPVLVLDTLAESIRRALDEKPYLLCGPSTLLLERTHIFTRIIKNQPLRVLNMSQLVYDDENRGREHHLYKKYDAEGNFICYAIRISAKYFKNWKEAKNKDYDFDLPTELNDPITLYITDILPQYGFSGKGSFPFFPSRVHKGKAEFVENLETCFYEQTLKLPGCVGFRPHACRHLVATDIIMNVDDGHRIAALVLHDQLTTVEKAYAHVKGKFGHKVWQDTLSHRSRAQAVDIARRAEQRQLEAETDESFLEKAKSVLGVDGIHRLSKLLKGGGHDRKQ